MYIGIIGFGAAAKRIVKILLKINNKFLLNIYTNKKEKNKNKNIIFYKPYIKNNLNEKKFFIANNSSDHFKFLNSLIRLNKDVYVEKPICTNFKEAVILKKQLGKSRSKILIGYQFRENKCIQYLKKIINKNRKKILSVFAYSGEDVKNYHKGENYKNSYTVNKNKGGGVLLTQSHQIDYLSYLFGDFTKCKSLQSDVSRKFSLSANVENNVSYLLKTFDGILINANLNYFGKKKTYIQIETLDKTITWTNNNNTISIFTNAKKKIIKFRQSREDMFRSRIKKFLGLKKKDKEDYNLFSTILIVDIIKKNYL